MHATNQKQLGIVKKFLQSGEKPELTDHKGSTAIIYAAARGPDVLPVLLEEGANAKFVGPHGFTPLMAGCQLGHLESVRRLLKEGCDPNATCDSELDYWCPLSIASFNNHPDIVSLLIQNGTKVSRVAPNGMTPIIKASQKCSQCVELLIEAGAQVNVRSDTSRTPLMLASEAGLSKAVHSLLSAGAELNAKDNSGHSALFYATKEKQYECVKILLDAGATD